MAPEGKAVEIADGVRDGRVVRITDAAHLPPAEVVRFLIEFFETDYDMQEAR